MRTSASGGDDGNGADTFPQRIVDHVEHDPRRRTDDGQIDRVFDLGDRAVGAYAGHRRGGRVNRVDDALEAGMQDVPEQVAAGRSFARRGADDGHAAR
jgi:hypothetical protein